MRAKTPLAGERTRAPILGSDVRCPRRQYVAKQIDKPNPSSTREGEFIRGESDTHTNHPILSSSGAAALVAALAETIRTPDEFFLVDLKVNTKRLYDLFKAWPQEHTDVSEALETLRILEEYLDELEKSRV